MPDTNEFNAEFFDDASAAWRSNKIVHKGGTFHYTCQAMSVSRGRPCGKKVYMKPGTSWRAELRTGTIPMSLYCWHHRQTRPNTTTENSS
jgi:hypothetical protein